MSAAKVCDFCGEPCKGYAAISMGGETRWHHHGDGPVPPLSTERTCYEKAEWSMSGVRPDQRWIDELTMHEVYDGNPDSEGV